MPDPAPAPVPQPAAPAAPARRPFLSFTCRFWGVLAAVLAVIGTFTVVGWFNACWWPLELVNSLRQAYVLVGLALALAFALGRKWRHVAVAGAIAAVNLAMIAAVCWGPCPPPPGPGPQWRVLLCNVHTNNRNSRGVLDYIKRERPDFVLLEELNARWGAELAELRELYPCHVEELEEDNFGIGFYSRHPAEKMAIIHPGVVQVASTLARFRLAGRAFWLVGTHPLPPSGGRQYWDLRNDQLARVGELLATLDGPGLLVGDLNATPWSHHFRALLAVGGLRDSRRGIGLQPSWPTFCPWFAIPIDHVLVRPPVRVLARRVGPDLGSDHYPLVVDFALE